MTQWLYRICATLIFVMTAAIFLQVLTRFVFHIALPPLQMVIYFSVSWLTMLGSAIGLQRKEHFAINLLADKPPTLWIRVVAFVREAIILIVLLALVYSGYKFVLMGLLKEDPTTGLSAAYTYSSVLAGALAMLSYFIYGHWAGRKANGV